MSSSATNPVRYVASKCPWCGREFPYMLLSYCPYCGNPLEVIVKHDLP